MKYIATVMLSFVLLISSSTVTADIKDVATKGVAFAISAAQQAFKSLFDDTAKQISQIRRDQLTIVRGDIDGVIKNISQATTSTDAAKRKSYYETSLPFLNQSIEKSWLLTNNFLEDKEIKTANASILTYQKLMSLQQAVLTELGEISTAENVQKESENRLQQFNAQRKTACTQMYERNRNYRDAGAAVAGTAGTTVAVAGVGSGGVIACLSGFAAGAAAGIGVFSWITAPIGCATAIAVGAVAVGAVAGKAAEKAAEKAFPLEYPECKVT